MDEDTIDDLLDEIFQSWPECSYHPVYNNCTIFAQKWLPQSVSIQKHAVENMLKLMVEGWFWSFLLHVCVVVAMALVGRSVRVADTAPSLRLSTECRKQNLPPTPRQCLPISTCKGKPLGNLSVNSVLTG